MRQEPTRGDRVRLATRDFEPSYCLGEAGTVESGPHFISSGDSYFIVSMDEDAPSTPGIILRTCEIELDAVERVAG